MIRLFWLVAAALVGFGFVHHSHVSQKKWIPKISNATSTNFEGTNDVVIIGTPAALMPNLSNTEFTVSVWFYPTSLAAQSYVVAHAEPFAGGGANMNYVIGVTTAGRLFGYFGATGKTTESAVDNAVVINTWYHAALTVRNISGTYTGNIWLNGSKQGSDVTSPGTDTTSSRSVRIGAGYVLDSPDTALPFVGYIDEVAFFSVGLTQVDVQKLVSGSGDPIDYANHPQAGSLITVLRMGDGSTYPTINDTVGSNAGTCTNMAGSGNFVSSVP